MLMTLLMAGCPLCGSNFMMLNTETRKGECVACNGTHEFTEKEISDAETRRDSLSEKYVSRLEKAFNDRDAEKMSALAEEVANEGISSWYAWFCVGWSDLQGGHTEQAFDDFKLAAYFIDEENFDEFYDLTMEAVLDSIERTTKAGEDWMTENTSMADFTGILFERFESLCEQDFMCDLTLRIGTLADSIESALMGGALIKEIMMIVLDYMSANIYVVDQQQLTNNAKSSVEAIDARMQEMAQDGSMSPNTVKIWGSGFVEFLQMMLDGQDALIAEYSDDQLFQLCDYWGFNEYGDVFMLLQDALDYHTGYMMSGKRNKGVLKKRDKALADYQEAFARPLKEGLSVTKEDGEKDCDRVCPDCGKFLKADETGFIECECGFRTRIATDAIYDLPENVPELVIMAKKASLDRDPMMLNNLGERILEFEQDNWHGFTALAESCLLDGQLSEGIVMFIEAAKRLDYKSKEEFSDILVEELATAIINADSDPGAFPVFITQLFNEIDDTPVCDCDIPKRLVRRVAEGKVESVIRGSCIILLIIPTISHGIRNNASLRYQRNMMADYSELCKSVLADLESVKTDPFGAKDDLVVMTCMLRDLTAYFADSVDARTSSMDDERIGFMAGRLAGDEGYKPMVLELMDNIYLEPDITYNPKSNSMLKAKHGIDRYLDNYLEMANSN